MDRTYVVASLALIGDNFDTDYVSKRLNTKPDKTRKKGEIFNVASIYKFTSWGLSHKSLAPKTIMEAFDREYEFIKKNHKTMLELSYELSAEWRILFAVYIEKSEIPLIYFSGENLEYFAKIEAKIDFDDYFCTLSENTIDIGPDKSRVNASLTLRGSDFDIDYVTERLKITPDAAVKSSDCTEWTLLQKSTAPDIDESIFDMEEIPDEIAIDWEIMGVFAREYELIKNNHNVMRELSCELSAEWYILFNIDIVKGERPIIYFTTENIQYLSKIKPQVRFEINLFSLDEEGWSGEED